MTSARSILHRHKFSNVFRDFSPSPQCFESNQQYRGRQLEMTCFLKTQGYSFTTSTRSLAHCERQR